MLQEHVIAVTITVLAQIFTQPDHIGFIHSDIYIAARIHLGASGEHFVYKRICLFFAREQDIACIANIGIRPPARNAFEMPQRLNKRDQFDTARRRISIQLFDLGNVITPAQVPKTRIADIECILRVKLQIVVSDIREYIYEFFKSIDRINAITRTVDERTETFCHISSDYVMTHSFCPIR